MVQFSIKKTLKSTFCLYRLLFKTLFVRSLEKETVDVLSFLREYSLTRSVPRNIGLDQARCLICKQVKSFGLENCITIHKTPANNEHETDKWIESWRVSGWLFCIRTPASFKKVFNLIMKYKLILGVQFSMKKR